MTLFEQIQEDLKTSMKESNEVSRDALRFLIAEIKREVVDSGGDRENIPDETVQKVLEKSAKARKESIQIFEQQGRNDLAEPEKKQLEVISKYLPEQLSDEELKSIVEKVKSENPSVQGMALMGKVMPLVKGKADPDRIKALL